MKYTITIVTEVEANDIVQAVRAASIMSDAIDEYNDSYEVVDIQFKKKDEIPTGYTHRGGMIQPFDGPNLISHKDLRGGTLRTFTKDSPQENSHG